METEFKSKQLSTQQELRALLKRKFPGDEKERTYLQLMIEGQAKAAIKGNVDAAKLLMHYANKKGRRGPKQFVDWNTCRILTNRRKTTMTATGFLIWIVVGLIA